MKTIYLVLSILGFAAPNVLVFIESFETGNIMLYARPLDTFADMFANRISSIFAIDLLIAVLVFFVWTYQDSQRNGQKTPYGIWIATMLLGLSGTFPLYLYLRERAKG